ncbi:toxin glutamine deamidase domain-containing protein [Micromonospora coxensis]|uniref:toxin glutamine deamidase domain-containing protein n=1 Tax=Micromonospora coxensis TaxID=356852 RepID=UPI003413DFCA
MSILPSPIPHPLQYSPWDLPGWVYEAFDWVIGVEWPEGDERAVWDLADEWYAVASTLTGPRDDAITAAAEVRSGYGGVGLVAEAFDTAWRRVAEGDDAPLVVLLAVSSDLGRLVEECGCDIEGAKLEVWIELGILVVELIALAVAAVLTAGAASPAAAAAITATRVLVQQIFKRLLAQLAKKELKAGLKEAGERAAKQVTKDRMRGLGKRSLKGGLEEAAEESGINLATQAYQNTTGRRDGLDMADLGASAVGGLAGGAVAPLAGLGRHAQGRGGRIAEHFGREMTGETMAEGAASLATGQGVLSPEDAARAAVSGATGSATGQADAALRARLDSQLGALAAPLPPMDLPLAPPPVTTAGEAPVPQNAAVGAGASTPAVSTMGGPAVGVHDGPVSATQSGPVAATTSGASPAPVGDTGSTATPAVSPNAVVADGSTGSSSSSASPTLSSVVVDRPPSIPNQLTDVPATAGQPTAQQTTTAAMATSGPVTASPSAPAVGLGSAGTSVPSVGSANVMAGGTSSAGSTPPLDSQHVRPGTASPHTPVVASHPTASTVAPPSTPRHSPEIGADPAPNPGGATPERNSDDNTGRKLNRFPELEALAPKTAAPPPSDVSPPVPPSPVDSGEELRPRTPEWYAAKWAAEREALERRRYQGYFESQRAWYEERRREDFVARLRRSASSYLDRARWLKRRAREFAGAGLTLRAEHMFKASEVAERDSYEFTDRADAVRNGELLRGDVVIDNAADFQRINDDVAELALGAVETSDWSALTWDDHPPPTDRSRPYGRWGGLRPPLALHQTDLERAMPRNADGSVVRTADPRQGGWFALANDGGSQADPTRGINCLDCTLSLYDTWVHGRPRVSAPRTFDGYTDGDISRPIMGEQGGPARVEEVTGGRFQRLFAIPEDEEWSPNLTGHAVNRRFDNLHHQLQLGGHGSYAFLITEWEGGGSHAWVALNQDGTILYLDPQSGAVRDRPLYGHAGVAHEDNVVGIDVLVLGGDGCPMPLDGLARGRFSALSDGPYGPHGPTEPLDNRLRQLGSPGGKAPLGEPSEVGGKEPPDQDEGAAAGVLAELTPSEHRVLRELHSRADSSADAVQDALVAISTQAAEQLGLQEPLYLTGAEHRVKDFDSLARKFLDEAAAEQIPVEDFAEDVNDVLRFCLVLPGGSRYVQSVEFVLAELMRLGFQADDAACKNFWRAGNRFYGFNATLRSPSGQTFELQLHTAASKDAWLETHDEYEVLRQLARTPAERVRAFLRMLSVNRERAMSSRIPHGLADRFPEKDATFAKWVSRNGQLWRTYLNGLRADGKSFSDVVREFGLSSDDFPVAMNLIDGLGPENVDILRSVS